MGRAEDRTTCIPAITWGGIDEWPKRGRRAEAAESETIRGDGADETQNGKNLFAALRRDGSLTGSKNGGHKSPRHVSMPSRMSVVTFNPSRFTFERNCLEFPRLPTNVGFQCTAALPWAGIGCRSSIVLLLITC